MKDPADWTAELERVIAEWRERHKLKEDDAIILLMELFRIHQSHWDNVRRSELPSFEQFRSDIAALAETARLIQQETTALLAALRNRPNISGAAEVPRLIAVFAALASGIAGFLLARGLP